MTDNVTYWAVLNYDWEPSIFFPIEWIILFIDARDQYELQSIPRHSRVEYFRKLFDVLWISNFVAIPAKVLGLCFDFLQRNSMLSAEIWLDWFQHWTNFPNFSVWAQFVNKHKHTQANQPRPGLVCLVCLWGRWYGQYMIRHSKPHNFHIRYKKLFDQIKEERKSNAPFLWIFRYLFNRKLTLSSSYKRHRF